MARSGLSQPLSEVFYRALRQKTAMALDPMTVDVDGKPLAFSVTVEPLDAPESLQGLVMVVFNDVPLPPEQPDRAGKESETDHERQVSDLLRELARSREEHQVTRSEMQAAQEGLMSANEELQSANEELTTSREEAITPPPRHTSPSYSTADCPGVTAHCGSLKSSSKPRLGVAAQLAGRIGLPVARLGGHRRPAPVRSPATQLHVVRLQRRDCSHGWSWPCTTHSVLVARSLRATNQGACSPPPRGAPLSLTPPMPRPWRWPSV
jgi:hypothetical protein